MTKLHVWHCKWLYPAQVLGHSITGTTYAGATSLKWMSYPFFCVTLVILGDGKKVLRQSGTYMEDISFPI